ncbi:MAG: hypothetical protein FJ295_06145 [Planctomycetes bacterium]|nr:hypothetical protein [Planctomycetota bacterium]
MTIAESRLRILSVPFRCILPGCAALLVQAILAPVILCTVSMPVLGQAPSGDGMLDAADIYAPQRVIDVSIEIAPEHWLALCNQTRDLLRAIGSSSDEKVFRYFPADVTIDGRKIANVGVRKKGFLGSLDSVRPSLKIKFDEFQSQQVASGFDRLTLNNNKQDPSRICQFFAYQFFNRSGQVASRCNLAKVTVNGNFLGIYSNVESVAEPFLKARFGDGSGALYEGTTTDLTPGNVDRLEAKNKAARHQEVGQLAEWFDSDEIPMAQVEQLLDIEAFVRFWASESLLGFWDGYTQNQNNYFIYQVPQTKKLRFIPWGLDSAFMEAIPLPQLKTVNKSVYANSVLANRLYRNPRMQKLYLDSMRQLLAEHWREEAMLAEVDQLAARVREHGGAEHADFDRRVNEIKAFLRGRRATIEKELASGHVEIPHGVRRPISSERIGSASGTFATEWHERTPSEPSEKGTVELRVELNGEVVEFSRLGVIAEPSQDRNAKESDGTLPPTVAFHGIRKSDEKQWLLVVSTNNSSFRPADQPAQVGGLIIEGNPLWFFAKMMLGGGNWNELILASGTVKFDEAAREPGASVRGRLQVELGRFSGGDHLPVR